MFAGDAVAVARTTNKLAVTEQEARACVEYYPSEERTKNLSKQTIMLAPAPPDSDDERIRIIGMSMPLGGAPPR